MSSSADYQNTELKLLGDAGEEGYAERCHVSLAPGTSQYVSLVFKDLFSLKPALEKIIVLY